MNQNHADNNNRRAIDEGQEYSQDSYGLLILFFVVFTLTTLTLVLPFVS